MEIIKSKYLNEVLSKIQSFSKKKNLLKIISGFFKTVIVSVLLFTFIIILEGVFRFSSDVRTFLFFFFIISFLALFSFLILPFLLKYFKSLSVINYYSLAKEIGEHFKRIQDELINSLQLLNADNSKSLYSGEFIDSAFYQTYKKIKNLNFEDTLSSVSQKKLARFSAGVIIVCFSFINLFPGVSDASYRFINFGKDFTAPPLFTFEIQPGDKQITKGEDVEIKIIVKGEKLNKVSLATKTPEQTGFQSIQLKTDSTQTFNYKIKTAKTSFDYYAYAKNIKSPVYSIKVLNRPIVKNLNVKIMPPYYSKQPFSFQKDNGNITALKGSKIKIDISSTKNIKSAILKFNRGNEIKMDVKAGKAVADFRIKKDDKYKIILVDEENIKNKSPIEYTINTTADEFPEINLISPVKDVSLSIDNRLPLSLQINDDFGFSDLKIRYKINSLSPNVENILKSINIPFGKKSNNEDVNYMWNMTDLNLTSNDVLSFYVQVFDNDVVSGPKSAKTKTINVRIPSLDELLTNTNNTYNKSVDELKKTLKKAEDLQKNLQKISQSLKKNKKKIDWKEQSKIKQTADKFKKLQKKAGEVAEELKKMREKLQKNNLLSEETLEKYLELQKLMESLSNEEMKKALEQMQNLLTSMDRKKIQDALKNFKFNEEQFKKSIERTLNLLKRIKISQKIDELLTRAKNIEKNENDINKNTKNSNSTKNKQLAKKQKQVGKSIESFKKELENLKQLMKELSDMPKESLDSLRKEFNKQKNKELSRKISQKLQSNKNREALQFQRQLSKNMKKMQSRVSRLQQEMRQKNQMETFVEMMKSLENLISLSKLEEDLQNATKSNPGNLSSFKKNAEKQNELIRSLNRVMRQLSKLSQKTFAITPEMGKALGDARRSMSESITGLQNRNGYLSSNKQQQAMGSLNDAASLLKSSIESMMKGGGKGGMMSLMQQLGQMAQQQMNLNNLTKGLQHNGKFSQQQLAQLKRLQQQQGLIRKSLQELNKEAKTTGKSKALAADLENILNRMQEVITNMQNKNVDDNLIQTQERILSKLLDAQRSVNERDYEKRRESLTGKDILRKSPNNFTLDDEKRNALREELIKAISEGYSKDYEELIKKYFEQLEKVKGQK